MFWQNVLEKTMGAIISGAKIFALCAALALITALNPIALIAVGLYAWAKPTDELDSISGSSYVVFGLVIGAGVIAAYNSWVSGDTLWSVAKWLIPYFLGAIFAFFAAIGLYITIQRD